VITVSEAAPVADTASVPAAVAVRASREKNAGDRIDMDNRDSESKEKAREGGELRLKKNRRL
jgi:hypothetical protein